MIVQLRLNQFSIYFKKINILQSFQLYQILTPIFYLFLRKAIFFLSS
jgi:hypothetical protein